MSRLDGKVAVVTGAAQGIGHAIAEGLAAEGGRIVIADLAGAAAAAGRLPARGGAAGSPGGVGLTVDVSFEEDVARMAEETIARCGRIDILVNNAGLCASLSMR